MAKLTNTTINVGKTSTVLANVSPREKSWRLVHDGIKVITLFEGEGETWAIWNMFCATTEKECLDEITRLKLQYIQEEVIEP